MTGTVALLYLLAILISASGCLNFFLRVDNWIGLGMVGLSAGAMIALGFRWPRRPSPILVQAPAGLLTGLLLQPSSAILIAVLAAITALHAAIAARSFVAVVVFGVATIVGLGVAQALMGLVDPALLRCP